MAEINKGHVAIGGGLGVIGAGLIAVAAALFKQAPAPVAPVAPVVAVAPAASTASAPDLMAAAQAGLAASTPASAPAVVAAAPVAEAPRPVKKPAAAHRSVASRQAPVQQQGTTGGIDPNTGMMVLGNGSAPAPQRDYAAEQRAAEVARARAAEQQRYDAAIAQCDAANTAGTGERVVAGGIGGVLGAVAGHQIGGGTGKKIATVVGAAAGAWGGDALNNKRNAGNAEACKVAVPRPQM